MKSELIASSFTTHRIESYLAPAFVTALEPSTQKKLVLLSSKQIGKEFNLSYVFNYP